MKKVKPFLRWAGGKSWFTKHIDEFLPENFNDYYEPFLGGGAIFFYLKSTGKIKNKAYLSDSNEDLINTYRVIKSDPLDLEYAIKKFSLSEKDYYLIREMNFDNKIERAAQFYYLNKTSFNGIYRVNRNGKFNVPYGHRNLKEVINPGQFLEFSDLLKNTFFSKQGFKSRCIKPEPQDLVFLDPPYTVAHENNGFVQYNQSIFSWENQIQLSKLLETLKSKKVNYIMTNAYHKSIIELYNTGINEGILRSSTVGGKGATRTEYKEIIISNLNHGN